MAKRLLDGSVKFLALGLMLALTPAVRAQDKTPEAWQRLSRLQCLIEYFYMETGVYPLDLAEMDQIFRAKAPRAPKPVAIPLDPAANQPFKYQVDAAGRRYTISVPDPAKYGGQKIALSTVDWGYLADLADLKRFEQIVRQMSNLMKAVATQCEMYAKDHAGKYPEQLDDLLPKYISRFPNDPLTGKNLTYKKLLDGYVIGCPNPERYGLKTFQYSSSQGIQMEQAPPKQGEKPEPITPARPPATEGKTEPAPQK